MLNAFNETDGPSICATINQASIDWAMQRLPERTRARYHAFGERLVVGEDLGPFNVGPLWIWQDLSYKRQTDAQGNPVMVVASPMMKTPTDYRIKSAAGFHYCKLLSPFRALEWMHTDGLRASYSLVQ